MIELFKENLTLDKISEIWYGWDNEGLLYGWENGAAERAYILLELNGYNMDSIKVMYEAYNALGELIGEL